MHSDVGGTFVDDARLSRIALKWMTDRALEAGLQLKRGAYRKTCQVKPEDAVGKLHRMGWIWALATYRRRPIPAGARVHHSVKDRLAAGTGYRLPTQVSEEAWTDQGWTQPSALAP